jgi:dTDP-4-amino-4,6-dideoxygalactose transaminase
MQLESIRNDKHRIFETYRSLLKKHVIIPQTEDETVSSEWMFICGISADYKDIHLLLRFK